MTKRLAGSSLPALVLSLVLVGCGGSKGGPGIDSGDCNQEVSEAYVKAGQTCQFNQYDGGTSDYKTCRENLEKFLSEYPKVNCEVAMGQMRTGVRIEHEVIQQAIDQLKQAEKQSGR